MALPGNILPMVPGFLRFSPIQVLAKPAKRLKIPAPGTAGHHPLPHRIPLYTEENCIPVEKLRGYFLREATRLAEAFDTREKTTIFTAQIPGV